MSEQQKGRPAFWGPLKAAWRQGLKEIAQYLPAFPENPRPIEEPGTMGNPTPVMVTDQLRAESRIRQDSSNIHDERLDRYAARGDGGSERQQEMER